MGGGAVNPICGVEAGEGGGVSCQYIEGYGVVKNTNNNNTNRIAIFEKFRIKSSKNIQLACILKLKLDFIKIELVFYGLTWAPLSAHKCIWFHNLQSAFTSNYIR